MANQGRGTIYRALRIRRARRSHAPTFGRPAASDAPEQGISSGKGPQAHPLELTRVRLKRLARWKSNGRSDSIPISTEASADGTNATPRAAIKQSFGSNVISRDGSITLSSPMGSTIPDGFTTKAEASWPSTKGAPQTSPRCASTSGLTRTDTNCGSSA
jgi:hypothetical protein